MDPFLASVLFALFAVLCFISPGGLWWYWVGAAYFLWWNIKKQKDGAFYPYAVLAGATVLWFVFLAFSIKQ